MNKNIDINKNITMCIFYESKSKEFLIMGDLKRLDTAV